jgi:hypothetical protein
MRGYLPFPSLEEPVDKSSQGLWLLVLNPN